MENYDIYEDIAERTQGDIYVGVVGPVRTGKSTFIKRFMELMVLPNIENNYKKERAKDELPQSASGKSIHTTEPKFVPNEAVEIGISEKSKFKVRMVDCVGYIVKGALGYSEGDKPKMVTTPWYDYEIPFEEAAEIGTKKVINEHSTIGLLVTSDGSVTDISRDEYIEAEERVINELKEINKPFIIVLNTSRPNDEETTQLKLEMESKYDVPVEIVDVINMDNNTITDLFQKILTEFPVRELNINMPEWIEKLDSKHWLKENYFNVVKDICRSVNKVRDINNFFTGIDSYDFLDNSTIEGINLGNGTAEIWLNPDNKLFYRVLSEVCESEIDGESQLLRIIKDLNHAKVEYDKISNALIDVRERGYGLVAPQLSEMRLEEPEIVRQGTRYGVKLKASAPSLHFIKANIETEISPIMGTERESEELVKSLLEQFESNPSKIWESNMFGRSLEVLVKDGLQNKLYKMPDDIQFKIQRTLEKIINEGNGGLICIIL